MKNLEPIMTLMQLVGLLENLHYDQPETLGKFYDENGTIVERPMKNNPAITIRNFESDIAKLVLESEERELARLNDRHAKTTQAIEAKRVRLADLAWHVDGRIDDEINQGRMTQNEGRKLKGLGEAGDLS